MLDTALSRLFLDRQADFWSATLQRAWSLREVRARVLEVVRETHDVKTFVLRPNARWRGHRAGQYVPVEVELDGVRARRCYSISSTPGDRRVAITVKRVPGGRVSGWLHDHLRAGDLLRLGQASGDFVLPEPAPDALLLLSGGSGITPVMSILRDLARRDAVRDVVFVHCARSREDVIFRDELAALAARRAGLRVVLFLDGDAGGGFDEARLARVVPDFAARRTFLCGPPGLMARVEAMWLAAGAGARLTRERFTSPPAPKPSGGVHPVELRLAASARRLTGTTGAPLLEQLEHAGERPPYGCRIGVCHTCRCRKRSGTIRDLVTGAESSAPDEDIRICVSAPVTDVELAL